MQKLDGKLKTIICLSCVMVIVGIVSRDLYTPSLPIISEELGGSIVFSSTLLVACLMGISFSQLLYGPLSDKFGRRRIVLLGLFICLTGNIGSCFSKNSFQLWAMQILCGIGAGACIVISRAILRDQLEGEGLIKAISYQSMASTLPPAIAPIIGAYVQTFISWQANFAAIFIINLSAFLLIIFLLPETLKNPNSSPISLKKIFKNYVLLTQHKVFFGNAILGAIFFSCIVIYSLFSPFIFQNQLKISVMQNGYLYLFTALGYLLGATVTNRLCVKISSYRIIFIAIALTCLSGGLMLGSCLISHWKIFFVVCPMVLVFMACGMITPIVSKQSIEPFPNMAGAASALVFSFRMFIPAIVGTLMALVAQKSMVFLAIYLLGAGTTSGIILWSLFKSEKAYNS